MRSFDGEMDMMDKQLMRMFQFPKIKMDHKWLKGSDKFWKGFPKKNEQARGSSFFSGSSFSSEMKKRRLVQANSPSRREPPKTEAPKPSVLLDPRALTLKTVRFCTRKEMTSGSTVTS